MEEFITGAALRKLWMKEKTELMQMITVTETIKLRGKTHERQRFNEKLTPYSPAYRRPYSILNDRLSGMIFIGGRKNAEKKGFVGGSVLYEVGDIYGKLDEVLFRRTDVETFKSPGFSGLGLDTKEKIDVAKYVHKLRGEGASDGEIALKLKERNYTLLNIARALGLPRTHGLNDNQRDALKMRVHRLIVKEKEKGIQRA